MKSTYKIPTAILIGFALIACTDSNNPDTIIPDNRQITIEASMQDDAPTAPQRVGISYQNGSYTLTPFWQTDERITLIFVQNAEAIPQANKSIEEIVKVFDISENGKSCKFSLNVPGVIDVGRAFDIYGVSGAEVIRTGQLTSINLSPVKSKKIDEVKIPVYFHLKIENGLQQNYSVRFKHTVAYEVVHIKNNSKEELSLRDCGLIPSGEADNLWYYDVKTDDTNNTPTLLLLNDFISYLAHPLTPPMSIDSAVIQPGDTKTIVSYYVPNSNTLPEVNLQFKVGNRTITTETTKPAKGLQMKKGEF